MKALGYMRTSSAANVGEDKDSEQRQRAAIEAYAARAAIDLVGWYYDAAVRGADPVETRPGFGEMLARIAGNGVRTIVVETANRFARDLIVQETGYRMLQGLGVTLIAADSPDAFVDDGPTATLIRQVLGAVAQFDKAMTVAKLRGARERKRRANGKCEGRKSHAELRPDMAAAAQRIAACDPKPSLRAIAAALEAEGFLSEAGTRLAPRAVAAMLRDDTP